MNPSPPLHANTSPSYQDTVPRVFLKTKGQRPPDRSHGNVPSKPAATPLAPGVRTPGVARVTRERNVEGGAEEAEEQLPEAQAWGVGTQVLPKTLRRRGGPRPYLQKRRRPRARGAGRSTGRGAPPSGGHGKRAGLGQRLGSASRAAAAARGGGGGGRRRARLRPRRLAAAGAEAAAAGLPAAGAATPAPGEEPRAPPTRAQEVLARRSGRSCSHPGPASAGLYPSSPAGGHAASPPGH
nr:uncharacterized protein LOC110558828 [Meriones unguiculatus]